MSGMNKASLNHENAYRSLEEEDPCYVVGVDDYNQALHVASIFILFSASALGVAFPLLAKHVQGLKVYPYLIILGKCAGAGVMLSCSLVHMILPSTEALTNECLPSVFSESYPAFSYVFALFAVFASHFVELLLESKFRESQDTVETQVKRRGSATAEVVMDREEDSSGAPAKPAIADNADSVKTNDQELAELDKLERAKQLSETLLVEFSLSVHSIFIGLGLALSTGSAFISLFIALIFHQVLEGVALGCRLADSSLIGFWYEMLLAFVFSLSSSVGIITGIGVYTFANQSSDAFLIVTGTFDGIAGGLLLYNGFLILLNDFSKDMEKHCRGQGRKLKVFGMFAALWIASFAMAILGAWA